MRVRLSARAGVGLEEKGILERFAQQNGLPVIHELPVEVLGSMATRALVHSFVGPEIDCVVMDG